MTLANIADVKKIHENASKFTILIFTDPATFVIIKVYPRFVRVDSEPIERRENHVKTNGRICGIGAAGVLCDGRPCGAESGRSN